MARIRSHHGFSALKVEGGILPPEYLQTIATCKATEQSGNDYGLSKSLVLKEEIARYWKIAKDLHDRYAKCRVRRDFEAVRAVIRNWSVPFLRDILGYSTLVSSGSVEVNERVFKLTHSAYSGVVPVLLVTNDFDLDKASKYLGHDGLRQAPHGIMQEYLNAEDSALWGIISNGSKLRILRDNVSLTRPSYIEADLDLIFTEDLYPDFLALWLTIHASRFRPTDNKSSNCIIESWRAKAHETGERIRENLRDGVANSLKHLGNGFLKHPKSEKLREKLQNGTLTSDGYFEQLLKLVYRLLFLFTAEERDLLHAPDATGEHRRVFKDGYSLSRLREHTLRQRYYDCNQDLWKGLQITFHAIARGCPGLGLPALGGLFRSDQCSDLKSAAIANEDFLKAIKSISFFHSGQNFTRINYRDMGTEELGSVYESLLELRPSINVATSPWIFSFVGDGQEKSTRGSKRKLTGSYYTPPTLVNELIKSTLEPVIDQTIESNSEDPRAAILKLKILDPACGSGHLLLAAARRLATEIARIESGTITPDEASRQRILRDVVQHCIYGVDINPLAVELCKTALWIETVEPGKPLTFLDSHIIQGDSLVGILDPSQIDKGVPNEAYEALVDDDKAVCRNLKKRNRESDQSQLYDEEAALEVAVASIDLDEMPEDTLADVKRKSDALNDLKQGRNWSRERLRANLFTAAFFAPKTHKTEETVPHSNDLSRLKKNIPPRLGVKEFVMELEDAHSFLHWHLAFGDIMQDGGFNVIVGNPPWKVSQLKEENFFASRDASIAELAGEHRKRAIAELNESDPRLWYEYRRAFYHSKAWGNFCRKSGRYQLSIYGKLNSYSLFAELFLNLIHPRGRAGLIVPTGIATDDGNKKFFSEIISKNRLVSLFDFENKDKSFPGIDSRIKFCLLTLSGEERPIPRAEFAFFLHQTEQLKERARRIFLSMDDFQLFNPNTLTCPIFRTHQDAEIAGKMYRRAGILCRDAKGSEPEKNPWGVSFMQMFNMTTASGLFKTQEELENEGWMLAGNVFVREGERYLPLYEGKMFHQYDHRFATFEGVSGKKPRDTTVKEKSEPNTVVIPRKWVPQEEVLRKLGFAPPQISCQNIYNASKNLRTTRFQEHRPHNRRENSDLRDDSDRRLGKFWDNAPSWSTVFRNITNATNERTVMVSIIGVVGLGHSATVITVNHQYFGARGIY